MAFITKNGQHIYLRNWEYNAGRMFTELATIVENNDGKVRPGYNWAMVSNGSVAEHIGEVKRKIKHINQYLDSSVIPCPVEQAVKKVAVRNTLIKELEELEASNTEPIRMEHFQSLAFAFAGVHYYVEIDTNPFFPQNYWKTPIASDGTYSLDACGEELGVMIAYDCMFSSDCAQEDIREIAYMLFNWLLTAKNSYIRLDTKIVSVPNTYNDGYHDEEVKEKERRASINKW